MFRTGGSINPGIFKLRKQQVKDIENDLERIFVETIVEACCSNAEAQGIDISEDDIKTIEAKVNVKVKEIIKKNKEEHKKQVKKGRPKGSKNYKTIQRERIVEIERNRRK